ncbi:MAG: PHP domain-containing protein [Candidatus Peregrinibacteria bacterium GW2011_GWF2_38_29]|nr:MAG: PHP domain-containing protein [Candidatus Peregrinibacteria bacterium GW2011_GWF2_38_29]HBB02392.1 hypothetical protein [Candidatus Peregrinibacteria bacterium]
MQFVADLHIHSKYSRATSGKMDLENLYKWAQMKGIKVMATGDFTHPIWFKELRSKLEPAEYGLFKLKPEIEKTLIDEVPESCRADMRFMLTSEVSSIYTALGKGRRVHNLIAVPSFEIAEKINKKLSAVGNLMSDGRPILGLPSDKLAEIVFTVSNEAVLVPAHVWTPYFSVFGSMSGFDSLEECFGKWTDKIFAIETGLSCYDGETEILTDDGWKKVSKVGNYDKICTLNPETNEVEFQNSLKIHSYKYKGKMYRLKTKRIDLLVTPNHKLFYSHCDFRKPLKFSLKEAELSFNKSKCFKKDGIWIGKDEDYFTLPTVYPRHGSKYYSGRRVKNEKKIPIESWLKFFGLWIAEGWVTGGGKDGSYSVCLANKDRGLILEMKGILESFGYNVFWNKKEMGVIRVRNYQLFSYLEKFGKAADKFVPLEVKSLSPRLLNIFFEYYIEGDGHVYGRNGKGLSATTISVRLRNDLQEVALKLGMSAYYKLHNKKGHPFKSPGQKYNKIYKQSADSWVIYFIRHNIHTVLPSTVNKAGRIEAWVDFDDKVYCVTVPNHVVYVRRNGIPVWCGNSDPAMNFRLSALDKVTLISNSDSHSLPRIGREANVFDTDLSYTAIFDAVRKKDPKKFLYTIEFFPEEGKYHFDGHADCYVSFSPEETRKHNGICPKCGRKVTVGVLNRVEKLADRKVGYVPKKHIPYKNLVSLDKIIADAMGVSETSVKVQHEYLKLIYALGNELKILLKTPIQEIAKISTLKIAEGVLRIREGKLKIVPGYDGEYGKIKIFNEKKLEEAVSVKVNQD